MQDVMAGIQASRSHRGRLIIRSNRNRMNLLNHQVGNSALTFLWKLALRHFRHLLPHGMVRLVNRSQWKFGIVKKTLVKAITRRIRRSYPHHLLSVPRLALTT